MYGTKKNIMKVTTQGNLMWLQTLNLYDIYVLMDVILGPKVRKFSSSYMKTMHGVVAPYSYQEQE